MTFAELKTMMQAYGYGTDTDTQQGLIVNAAYRRICARRAWSWLRAQAVLQLTIGQTEYTWTDFAISSNPPRRLESARILDTTTTPTTVYGGRGEFDYIEPQQWNDLRGSTATVWPASERGLPRYWTRIAATGIGIWYPPDLGYTLHLNYIRPADVLTGSGEPLMPRDYHDAIVWEAIHGMAIRQRDQIAIASAAVERDFWLTQLEAEDHKAQAQSRERVSEQAIWTDMERV